MTKTAESQKEVTIVIPNYNGKKFLDPCIKALSEQTFKDFRILVIDNGSADGSLEYLQEKNIDTISFPYNIGFAPAVNAGISAAETPYVILLNNDTEPEKDFVNELLKAIKKSEKIFSVSALMIKASDHSKVDDAGDGMSVLGWAYQRGLDNCVSKYNSETDTFSACGGASIYRRTVFDEIGLFDEAHFAYLEDIDIGWRARIHGYKNMYCPDAKVYHVGSGTSGSKYNDFKVRLSTRNNIYLHHKNQPLIQLIINFIPLLLGVIIKAVFFTAKGLGTAYFEGLSEGLKNAGKLKKVRGGSFVRYICIEWMMIKGTFVYLLNHITR